MTPQANQMPVKAAVDNYSKPANLTPPMPMAGSPPPPPMGGMQMPTAQASPVASAQPIMGGAMPGLPSPGAPAAPPYTVRLQADGSSVYVLPSPDGDPAKDIVLSRNEPPRLPKAFQTPSAPTQPGA